MDFSNVNPIVLFLVIILGLFIIGFPKKWAFSPFLIAACFITMRQCLMIGSLNFYMTRILIIFGILRILTRRELKFININNIDMIFIFYVISAFTIYVLREMHFGALINRLGFSFDAIGLYFIFRVFIETHDDIIRIIKTISILTIPIAISMLIEIYAGRNIFAILGGEEVMSSVREGRIRAQGPFMHSILAGTLGATSFPLLFAGLSCEKKHGLVLFIGILSTVIVVYSSASSGPVLSLFAGIISLILWRARDYIKVMKWGMLIIIIILHIIMKAPVWYIFDRISLITGGGGWHRSELINSFIKYFNDWWLIGTSYTRHWMPNALPINPNMVDITNQFVRIGVDGGLITLILFLFMILKLFKSVGINIRNSYYNNKMGFFNWALGCSLITHIFSFFSVSYFDQINIFWYLLLGMIAGSYSNKKMEWNNK